MSNALVVIVLLDGLSLGMTHTHDAIRDRVCIILRNLSQLIQLMLSGKLLECKESTRVS